MTGVERKPSVAAEARSGGIEVHELDYRRLDELPGCFDAVICMWASFGWYEELRLERADGAGSPRRLLVFERP